jgi:hypothetical protein
MAAWGPLLPAFHPITLPFGTPIAVITSASSCVSQRRLAVAEIRVSLGSAKGSLWARRRERAREPAGRRDAPRRESCTGKWHASLSTTSELEASR